MGGRIQKMLSKVLRPVSGLFNIAVAAVVATPLSLYVVENIKSLNTDGAIETDAFVIFEGNPTRILRGFERAGRGSKAQPILVSGIPGAVTQDTLPSYLPYGSVAENDTVVPGYKAKDTEGNADETCEWLSDNPDIESITLVTAEHHMARSWYELRQCIDPDIDVVFQRVAGEDTSRFLVSEILKVAYLKTEFLHKDAYRSHMPDL